MKQQIKITLDRIGNMEHRTSEYLSELKIFIQTSFISIENGVISLFAAIIKRFKNCKMSTLQLRYLKKKLCMNLFKNNKNLFKITIFTSSLPMIFLKNVSKLFSRLKNTDKQNS